jgi:multiple sugar transport system substrate-binding protein
MANSCRISRSGRRITRRNLLGASAGVAGAVAIGARGATRAAARQGSAVSGDVLQWCYPLAAGGDQAANDELWAGLAEAFKAQNPDADVTVEVLPWADRNTKLTTALAADAGPDVGYLNADFVPQHAGDGSLEPLDDVIAGDIADFTENARTNLTFDGQLYSVPILGSVTTLLYNTKVLDAAGITTYPTTWDELLAAGPAIKESGKAR